MLSMKNTMCWSRQVLLISAILLLGLFFVLMCGCGGGGGGGNTVAASTPPPPVTPAPVIVPGEIGANLSAVHDWSATHEFVDLVKQARSFGTPTTPWDEAAALGADGWPTGDSGIVLMTSQAGVSGLGGTYHIDFTGTAVVALVSSSGTLANQAYDAASDTTRVDLQFPEGGDQLMLSFTAAHNSVGSGIKNLRVIRPGYSTTNAPLFTNEFLQHIARFDTLRFMEWSATNGNPQIHWADRPTPQAMHTAPKAGQPWEYVVALANLNTRNIWINIPAGADNDYASQLAQYLYANLNSTSKVYLEYSNEVWNNSFPQYLTNQSAAAADIAANPASVLVYDHSTNLYLWSIRQVARRLKEIGDAFRSAWGVSSARIVPVLAGQASNPYALMQQLEFVQAVYGPPGKYFSAIAGAPYATLGTSQTVDGQTPAQILTALAATTTAAPVTYHYEKYSALALWYGLQDIAYEGGLDTSGSGSIAAKKAAILDPQTLNICTNYLNAWFGSGKGMFMWFTAGAGSYDTQYGTWPLTTDLANETVPKIQCLDAVPKQSGITMLARNIVPGLVDARAFADNNAPYADPYLRYVHTGDYRDYVVAVPAAGNYQMTVLAASFGTNVGASESTLAVLVNGSAAAQIPLVTTNSNSNMVNSSPVSLTLKKGLNVVRIQTAAEVQGWSMQSMTIVSN